MTMKWISGIYVRFMRIAASIIAITLLSWVSFPSSLFVVRADTALFPYESNPISRNTISSLTVNSEDENYRSANLLDDNALTGWHSNFYVPATPYVIEVQFTQNVTLDRIGYVPFSDAYHNDAWLSYQLYVAYASDGLFFPYESGVLSTDNSHKLLRFDAITIRKLQIVITATSSGFASAAELKFFEADALQSSVFGLFNSHDFSSLKSSTTLSQINQLRTQIVGHSLEDYLATLLDRADALLANPLVYLSRIYTPSQRGNPVAEAELKQLVTPIPYYQVTGLYATSGEVITVHVGGASDVVMPSLCFSSDSPACEILQPGTNTLVVPDGALGPIYLSNPYDAIAQPIIPTLAIEGGTRFPVMKKGDNATTYRDALTSYIANPLQRSNQAPLGELEDGYSLDVTELIGDYFTLSIPATLAHEIFVIENVSISNFFIQIDEWMLHYHRFLGLNFLGEPIHKLITSPVFFRYGGASLGILHSIVNLGTDDNLIRGLLRVDKEVLSYEMLETVGQLFMMQGWVDVYNNEVNLPGLMALYVQDTWFDKTRLHSLNSYQSLYTHLFVHEAIRSYSKLNQLAAQWQLYLAFGIAPFQTVASYLRTSYDLADANALTRQSVVAYLFSLGAGCDLTTYYESIGYEIDDTYHRTIERLDPCGMNINLIDERVQDYAGNGLPVNHTSSISKIEKHSLFYRIHINYDAQSASDILGFYIYRDGEAIAFTNAYVYDDYTADSIGNHIYQIRPIDLKTQAMELSKTPTLRVEQAGVDFTMTSICDEGLCGTTDYRVMFDHDSSSAWETIASSQPKNLIFEFGYTKAIYGFTYTPSQDEFVGKIDRYTIYVSEDGLDWGTPIYAGELIYTRGVNGSVGVYFMKGYEGRYLRIAIETDHESQMIGIGELELVTINTSGTIAFIILMFVLIGVIPYIYLSYTQFPSSGLVFKWLSGTPIQTTSHTEKGGKPHESHKAH